MKKPKVPGTTDATNREQRRAAERGRQHPEHDDAQAEEQRRKLIDPQTPPDVTSVRAKSSRHGKSTADKWNQ